MRDKFDLTTRRFTAGEGFLSRYQKLDIVNFVGFRWVHKPVSRYEAKTATAQLLKQFKPKAICFLRVADVEATPAATPTRESVFLRVVQDKPDHANIVGLPEVLEEPPFTSPEAVRAYADAEKLGGLLAARATLVWQKPSPCGR